ncbi:MAG: hypothetical protein AB7O44_27455 [Hyphomicrobiaceae bacterium]
MATPIDRELLDLLLALAFLLGVALVVLIDLHFYWARGVTERQADIEARIKALEDRT